MFTGAERKRRRRQCAEQMRLSVTEHDIRKRGLWKARERVNGPSTLKLEDIPPLPKRCPILGVPFVMKVHRKNVFMPSIDKVIPSKGYVKGNIQWVTKLGNAMKHDHTLETLSASIAKLEEPIKRLRRVRNYIRKHS